MALESFWREFAWKSKLIRNICVKSVWSNYAGSAARFVKAEFPGRIPNRRIPTGSYDAFAEYQFRNGIQFFDDAAVLVAVLFEQSLHWDIVPVGRNPESVAFAN